VTSMVELSIIIVNWNSADYVLACIRSIRKQTSKVCYEIIVVDNASFDCCGDRLASGDPGVVFVQSRTNLGFACANNLGVQHAHGSVLLFLNPDTVVLDQAIERLYKAFQTLQNPGVVGCRLLNSDGSLQTSCVQAFPTVLNQTLDAEILRRWFPNCAIWGTEALFRIGAKPAEVEAVSGACMMMRRDAFDRVHGFSTDYFMYAEDLDLSFKTRRAAFRNYYLSEPAIIHHGGGSSQRTISKFSTVMMAESVSRFLGKSRGAIYSSGYRFSLSIAAAIRLALLCLIFPACIVLGGTARWSAIFLKWFVTLRWGLGLERWAKQYQQVDQLAPCANEGAEKPCATFTER
jgi:N-acetylglucosaminyl-diphospho-decaprenol L-rhamnosyltransferase